MRQSKLILGIESSCDDTCAAVIDAEGRILANVISSQHVHDRFGGVVPEIAARHHLALINAVIEQALRQGGCTLEQIDLVAVTRGPGLIGALLVGLSAGKALAAAGRRQLAPVDHLHGHLAANFLHAGDRGPLEPPFLCLIASGGHTLLCDVQSPRRFELLGSTLDDAAGEAFDKGARLLGLGFPGGAALERLARNGDATAFDFPAGGARGRPGAGAKRFRSSLDFSFAGVKTALLLAVRGLTEQQLQARRADLAASYQRAILDSLLARIAQALETTGRRQLAIGGGVAANGVLRERLLEIYPEVRIPPRELCTDNAAMIASAGRFVQPLAYPAYLKLDAYPAGGAPLSVPALA